MPQLTTADPPYRQRKQTLQELANRHKKKIIRPHSPTEKNFPFTAFFFLRRQVCQDPRQALSLHTAEYATFPGLPISLSLFHLELGALSSSFTLSLQQNKDNIVSVGADVELIE